MTEELKAQLAKMTEKERAAVLKAISDPSVIKDLYYEDYDEIPVDIMTFISDPYYLGAATNNGSSIYPYWKEQLVDIFDESKSYSEVALTGSIGCGKSHIAVIALCYATYRLMCLKDPATFYKLAKGSPIYIVFLNLTVNLSQGVAYSKFNQILLMSPWFLAHGHASTSAKSPEYIPNNTQIKFTAGSQVSHVIGKDVYAYLMDEINFGKGSNSAVSEKNAMMELFNNVSERVKSRFIVDGKVRGKGFLVSSKKSEYDFLETWIKKQRYNENVKICDAVLFKIKPQGTYSGKMFAVAYGGSNMPSLLIPNSDIHYKAVVLDNGIEINQVYVYDDIVSTAKQNKHIQDVVTGDYIDGKYVVRIEEFYPDYERQGYNIEKVPIEFKQSFELDINSAIQNVLGIVVSNTTKFISYASLAKCYEPNTKNAFAPNIITTGCKDSYQLRDFFHPEYVPEELYSKPIFIHLDCSINGDRTGISAVAVLGFKYQNRYDAIHNVNTPTKELMYKDIFSVGIQAPTGDEISFQKEREFLYYLKYDLGWNIKFVSTDGFNSYDLRQQLNTMGFQTELVSLDRKPDGYLALRSAINEQRIVMSGDLKELEHELINLERDSSSGKIDHTPENSKDIADSLAGALFNASEHNSEYSFEVVEVFSETINDSIAANTVEQDRENLLSMITPLNTINRGTDEEKKNSTNAYNDYSDLLDSFIIF